MTPKQRDTFAQMLRAGQMCSNVCFNLAQDPKIEDHKRESMRSSAVAWDQATRDLREVMPEAFTRPHIRRRRVVTP